MADTQTSDIQKRIDALPEDLRQYVYSEEMAKVVQEIAKKNSLHIDQAGDLESEAAAFMIGLSKPEEFVQNLANVLEIDEQKATTVAKDVNDMLFVKIRESLKTATGYNGEIATPKSVSAPAAVAQIPPVAASTPSLVTTPVATPKPAMPNPVALTTNPTPMPTVRMEPPKPMSTIPTPAAQTPASANTANPTPTPAKTEKELPVISSADVALTQKTVNVPPPAAPAAAQPAATPNTPTPPQPNNYKADPYREPVEP